MEEIWKISSVRNNLLIVSVIVFLVVLFSKEVTDINIFWIIKLSDVNSIKILCVLAVANIYTLIRYYQYLKRLSPWNYILIFIWEILNSHKDCIYEIYTNMKNIKWVSTYDKQRYSMSKKWSIRIDWYHIEKLRYLFSRDECSGMIYEAFWTTEKPEHNWYIDDKKYCYSLVIRLGEDNVFAIFIKKKDRKYYFLKFKSFFTEKYYWDYNFPLIFWWFSICLLEFMIFFRLGQMYG